MLSANCSRKSADVLAGDAANRGADEGLCGRGLPRMCEFYLGAQWVLFEVRDLWDDGDEL